MNIIKRIRTLLNIEKQYEELKDRYDSAIITMSQQAKRINALETKIERDSNTVRHDVELFNKKRKDYCGLDKEVE